MDRQVDNLQALRNSKAALDLGLITQSDYDGVKAAFLGAQQLRAAMDAGLIREDDFEKSKFAYLSSLSTFAPHIEKPGQVAIQPPPLDAAAPLRTSVLNGARQATLASHPVPSTQPQHTEPAAAPKYLVGGSQEKASPIRQSLTQPAFPRQDAKPTTEQSAKDSPIPSNIPKLGGAKTVSLSGVSMSGIALTEDAVNLYYLIRAKSTYKWATWQIDDAGTKVIISAVGDPSSNYKEFLSALPEQDCRYGVFDFQATTADGQVINKLIFFNWAPDTARVKSKMMYASTKDFFKGHLDGISAEFQASDLEEIAETAVEETVQSLKRG